MTRSANEEQIVRSIENALAHRGWGPSRQSFFGRKADVLANLPDGDVLLVEVKTSSDRVRFSDIAQLAEWAQLANAVDQIGRAYVLLVTDGDVSESIDAYARQAGIWLVPVPSPAAADVGERVIAEFEQDRARW